MDGAENLLNGQQIGAERRFGFAPGGLPETGAAFPEGKEGVAFHQLHQGRGLRLCRGRSRAHLLARGHDASRVRAADAEIDRDTQTVDIDAAGFGQNIGLCRLKPGAYPAYGFFRRDGLVEIVRISLGTGRKADMRKAHGRSRTRIS